MASLIAAVAAAVRDEADGLTIAFTANSTNYTSTLKGYWPPPRDFDQLPAAVVELPAIGRPDPDEAELQLGSRSYSIEFPVTFYFDVGDVIYTQQEALATVEEFIDAVDANPSLGDPSILDTKVTEVARPELEKDQNRVLLRYEATVEVIKLVSY